MRTWSIFFPVVLALGLAACGQTSRHEEPAARQAGRDAARATQDLERDANKAARELRDTGNQFRQGWNEGKHEERSPRKQE